MKQEMSLLEATRVALSRPRWIIIYPLAVAVIVLGATYLMRPRYTSTVAFAAERLASSGVPASLSGLAGEFGLNVLTDVGRSPAYYLSVLDSRQLKQRVLEAKLTADSVPVLVLLDAARDARTRAESLEAGVKMLTRITVAREDPRTGIIRLSVETTDPILSAAIATRYVEELNQFNTAQRQSQARERRRFIESRISTAERALRDAEETLRRFYQSNPAWSRSSMLMLEGARLRSGVDAARDIYLTLQREFELARIEEITETPVLTIIDPAVPALTRSWPRRKALLAGILIVGVLVGMLATFVADYLRRARVENPDEYARLSLALRPWRR